MNLITCWTVIGNQTGVMVSRLKPGDPLHGPVEEIFRSGNGRRR
ncbi:MAG: hypothetical protein R3B08_01070 [Nitrospira sp.]